MSQRLVSIVIPIHNEKDNVRPLYQELKTSLSQIPHEIIFSNDGSYDGTTEILENIAINDSQVVVLNFRRNFGQTAAMQAGFDHASGEIIIAMDGDLQNDPADIPKLIAEIEKGYDLVSGWRKNRKDKAISRKIPSYFANRIISNITGVQIHDYGCSMKAYRKSMLKHVDLYGEMHRFIPALSAKIGAKITEIVVNHRPRVHGQTKYGISRTFRVLMDLLVVRFLMKFQSRPIHFIGVPGFASFLVGSAGIAYLVFIKLALNEPIGQRPLLMLSVLLILVGVQFLGLGLIAEFLTRIYYESTGKKTYILKEKIQNKTKSET